MNVRPFSLPEVARASLVAVLGVAAVALSGCGKDDPASPNQNPPTSTTYTGATTGSTPGSNGKLTVTIATGTPAPGLLAQTVVTAEVEFQPTGGSLVELTGTWDTETNLLHVDSGGWMFDGGFEGSNLEGYFSGPGGESGVFSLFNGGAEVVVMVGEWGPATPAPGISGGCSPNGSFNFSIHGAVIRGNAYNNCTTEVIPLDGTYNTPDAGHIIIYRRGTTDEFAQGDYDPSQAPDASGTWNDGTNSGDWSGDRQ